MPNSTDPSGGLGNFGSILAALGLGRSSGAFGVGIGTPSGAKEAGDKAAGLADPWGQSGKRDQFAATMTPDSVMAMLGLAIAAHADDLKNPADRPLWTDWSLELQREMTQTAAALRRQDAPAVLEHFKAAQVACDKCHEKFKR